MLFMSETPEATNATSLLRAGGRPEAPESEAYGKYVTAMEGEEGKAIKNGEAEGPTTPKKTREGNDGG